MHRNAVVNRHRDYVGQIILALRIVVAKIRQPDPQLVCRTDHHTRIDFPHRFLIRSRIFFLNNATDATGFTNNSPIAGRVIHVDRQDSQVVRRCFVEQSLAGRRQEQRHITKQYQDAVGVRRVRNRLLQRVAGTELFRLQRPAQRLWRERVADDLTTMPVDHAHVVGCQRRGAVEHVREQWLASQWLQHFWQVRAHARSLSCGEDDRT